MTFYHQCGCTHLGILPAQHGSRPLQNTRQHASYYNTKYEPAWFCFGYFQRWQERSRVVISLAGIICMLPMKSSPCSTNSWFQLEVLNWTLIHQCCTPFIINKMVIRHNRGVQEGQPGRILSSTDSIANICSECRACPRGNLVLCVTALGGFEVNL